MKNVTGIVYSFTGASQVSGAIVMSFLSFLGAVLLWRAFKIAVPNGAVRPVHAPRAVPAVDALLAVVAREGGVGDLLSRRRLLRRGAGDDRPHRLRRR